MTTIIQHIPSPVVVVATTKSNDDQINNDTKQTIFFRFGHGKTMTLTVNPNIEIILMKQMLLQKIALSNAIETNAIISNNNNTTLSSSSSSVLTKVLGLLWLSSLLSPKLQPQDLSFIYRGKPLDDDMSFQTYYYNHKSWTPQQQLSSSSLPTIHVTVRLNGGCFMVSASVLGLIITAIIGSTCTCGLSLIAVPFLLPLLFILPFFCL